MSSSLSKKIITYDAVERYHDNLEEQLNNEYLRKDELPIEEGVGDNSIVQRGSNNIASGTFSVALGKDSNASGNYSFASGNSVASGEYSHAEGVAAVENGVTRLTKAIGKASHAEGGATKALSEVAHAEGLKTISGRISQLIDPTTGNIRELTNEEYSILVNEALRIGLITSQNEFNNDVAMKLIGFASHSEGSETKALGTSSHAEGNNTEASSNSSHAEGDSTHAWGEASHAEGYLTEANGNQSHSEGKQTKAQGNSSHAEGIETTASKEASHAEGTNTIASGNSSHAEGIETQANGWGSHAEGGYSITTGSYSHIEGRGNYIGDNDNYSTDVVDTGTKAYCAHSEGQGTKATGNSAHAEGALTEALGTTSHAEGYNTTATASHSHAEGCLTKASGYISHAEGLNTRTYNEAEHASGKYNKSTAKTEDNTTAEATHFSIGIGTSETDRKNAFEVKQNGDIYVDGVEGRIQDRLNIDMLVPIQYIDLKRLRDQYKLIPGQKYRIIDYITTTTQEGTSSAFHPFDVIVTALDEHTLSENASAVKSDRDGDGYFGTENVEAWQLKYCLDNDTERFAWADNSTVQWYSRIVANYMVDQSGTRAYSLDKDAYIYDYGTMPHPDTGEDTLVFYTQNPIYFEEAGADYGDIYFYNGITTVDGVEYDSWRKFSGNDWVNANADGEGVYALTERIVFDDGFVWPDRTGMENGKGVIYNMIDEYGNECPYDFKNIKFYHDGLATNVYTFTWIDEEYNVMDASVFGNNGTLTYNGMLRGVNGNVIKPYMKRQIYEDHYEYQSLNSITFISDYEFANKGNAGFYGYNYNSFGGNCHSNSFGNGCSFIRFGNGCVNNSFGNDCVYNSFGDNCVYNSFGDKCSRNSFSTDCSCNRFGNDCDFNSFGNDCDYNEFGDSCHSNSFGNNCDYNSFGNNCEYNSFGNDCNSNDFGEDCWNNSFGNNCMRNSFRLADNKTAALLQYCYYNHFDDGCSYNVIWNSVQPTSSNKLQNMNVVRGVCGTSSAYNFINMVDKNTDYEIKVAKNSSGEIKIYCEADLIA